MGLSKHSRHPGPQASPVGTADMDVVMLVDRPTPSLLTAVELPARVLSVQSVSCRRPRRAICER